MTRTYRRGSEDVRALPDMTRTSPRWPSPSSLAPSGTGRSTRLNILGGIDRPTRARVSVAGLTLHDLSEPRLGRDRGGFLFQFNNLRGIGETTEMEASRSEGRSAVAIDGNYHIDSRLEIEFRNAGEVDPGAEYSKSSIELSLEDVIQPVDITFPPECLAAEASGEG